jgi:hypothetical protein
MTTYKLLKYPEWMLIPSEWHSELIQAPSAKGTNVDMFCPEPLYRKYINPEVHDLVDAVDADLSDYLYDVVLSDKQVEEHAQRFFQNSKSY